MQSVVLCCMVFGVRVSVTFHLMYVHINYSSVWVAEWPPFLKELLSRLTICSLCILTFVILVISRFGFEGWIWVLIALVPGLCTLFACVEYLHNVCVKFLGHDTSVKQHYKCEHWAPCCNQTPS